MVKPVHPVKMKKEQNKNGYVRLCQHVKSDAENIHNVHAKQAVTSSPTLPCKMSNISCMEWVTHQHVASYSNIIWWMRGVGEVGYWVN